MKVRNHLTEDEIAQLIKGAGSVGRHKRRDKTMIRFAFRHGLRCSELVSLGWSCINLDQATVTVSRRKNGIPSVQPLDGTELRQLRELRRKYPDGPVVFQNERGGELSTSAVRHMVARAGREAEFNRRIHPHMLRHSTGYALTNRNVNTRQVQNYLGHNDIRYTEQYTALKDDVHRDIWAE